MDLNIGTAFWFAARGRGHLQLSPYATRSCPQLRRATGLSSDVGRAVDSPEEPADRECASVGCKRVSKAACVLRCCKRCCNAASEARGLGSEEEGGCPAHRVTEKQRAKMRQNAERRAAWQAGRGESPALLPAAEGAEDGHVADHADHAHRDTVDEQPVATVIAPYVCACRVLLVGLGADEQMAGYGRHRTVFARGGYAALAAELNLDMGRLWTRNLGRRVTSGGPCIAANLFHSVYLFIPSCWRRRDDRCIADKGREAWFPYLDEGLVALLQQLPLREVIQC